MDKKGRLDERSVGDAVFLLILVACDGEEVATPTPIPTPTPTPTYNVEEEKAKLTHAKDSWNRFGSDDYIFEAEAHCFCDIHAKPVRIVVINGAIESIRFLDPNEIYHPDYSYRPLQTINDLFNSIEGSILVQAKYLTVEYHIRLGYPVYFRVSSGMIDDGYRLVITSYTPQVSTPTFYNLGAAKAQFFDARELWEANGSDDYVFESVAWCNCPQSGKALQITVKNGAIEEIEDVDSKRIHTDEREFDAFYPHQTINDLFGAIERAVGSTPARYLGVDHHPILGYPLYLKVSFSHVFDDGYSLVITSYTPLNPSSPQVPPETSSRPPDSVERHASVMDLFSGSGDAMFSTATAATVEEVLEKRMRLTASPSLSLHHPNNPTRIHSSS